MNRIRKTWFLGAGFVVLMCAGDASDSPLGIAGFSEARAIIGVAPGGSVARRRAVAGTAVVASTTANASAAAAANASAAAAAAAPPPPAAPAGPPPVGTTVTMLPPGCTATKLNGVDYQRCGSTYYTAALQGSNLVYVVAQP